MYSSIIRKPCKCGCGKMPTTGYAGFNAMCRLDLQQEKVSKIQQRQNEVLGVLDKEDEESRKNLIEDLDTTVSRYIRLKYADEKGNVGCYTCTTVKHFSRMQCGHFIPRANLATRWLETNLRVQDEECNCHKNGNLEVFRDNLNKEHEGLADWLQEQARQVVHPGKFELKELLISYRQKLKVVESKLKK